LCEAVKQKLAVRRTRSAAGIGVREQMGEGSTRRDSFFDVTKRLVLGIDSRMDFGSTATQFNAVQDFLIYSNWAFND
jgi:hypothetical protein